MREVYYGNHFRKDFRLLIKRGLDISMIREVWGHASIGITGDIYTHPMPGKQKQLADKRFKEIRPA